MITPIVTELRRHGSSSTPAAPPQPEIQAKPGPPYKLIGGVLGTADPEHFSATGH